jgi:hypothetical protein
LSCRSLRETSDQIHRNILPAEDSRQSESAAADASITNQALAAARRAMMLIDETKLITDAVWT